MHKSFVLGFEKVAAVIPAVVKAPSVKPFQGSYLGKQMRDGISAANKAATPKLPNGIGRSNVVK